MVAGLAWGRKGWWMEQALGAQGSPGPGCWGSCWLQGYSTQRGSHQAGARFG